MALTPTIGVFYRPFYNKEKDQTPARVEYFQTSGSGATSGVLQVIGTASAADKYYITNISVYTTDPTAASLVKIHMANVGVLASFPTATLAPFSMFFGDVGVMVGDVLTNTVALVSSGGTCTMNFICTGYTLK